LTKFVFALLALCALANPPQASGQTPQPDQTTPAAASPAGSAPQPAPPAERPVSWKRLLPNLIGDQKRIWSFPARIAQGQNLLPAAAVLGATAGLLAVDPIEAGYFHRSLAFQGFNSFFTSNATIIGTIAAPVSLYAAGLIRKDAKMQRTALLAGEAVANAEILTTVLKDATNRVRPSGIPAGGNYSDSWFEGGSFIRGKGSFPSGHTIAAFSIATVVARRYGNHRWVPYAAYGLAAVVGFSRLSLSAHFLSDVFVGGALGYSISRFAVMRQ
jgi:membrane-associated phospholipid phosphatase